MQARTAPRAPVAPTLRAAPQRRTSPVLPEAHRPPFRVLQNGRAPAQLSLFLRPSAIKR